MNAATADSQDGGVALSSNSGLDPAALFPFPLDDFQLEAVAALNQGHSVVVSAPTGSGKTLIGEYAIRLHGLSDGDRNTVFHLF